MSFVHHIVR